MIMIWDLDNKGKVDVRRNQESLRIKVILKEGFQFYQNQL